MTYFTLTRWVNNQLATPLTLELLAGDASLRRYYRARNAKNSWIVMDASCNKETLCEFVAIANALSKLNVLVPKIVATELTQGFLILSDLGDRLLFNELNVNGAQSYYPQCFQIIRNMQQCSRSIGNTFVPNFDRVLLQQELNLFMDWYLGKLFNVHLTSSQSQLLIQIFELLINSAVDQPQTFVHRDFHSRNLMVCENKQLAVLDFQDAVWGPISYDLVSLLRDCYIDWPMAQVDAWVATFYHQANYTHQFGISLVEFQKIFDLMGIQRHLKCIGIFSRLKLRDKKDSYLQYIPRLFQYIIDVGSRHVEFTDFIVEIKNWQQSHVGWCV